MSNSGKNLRVFVNFDVASKSTGREDIPFFGIPKILSYIVRDFIESWYKDVSSNADFINGFNDMCKNLINNFSKSSKEVNWISFFTQRVVEDFTSHLRLFRHTEIAHRKKHREMHEVVKNISANFTNNVFDCKDHVLTNKILLGILRRTDNKEELAAFLQISKHELKVQNAKDSGDKDGIKFKFVSYRVLKIEVIKEKIRFILQFFSDKGENASQAAEIVNGVYGAVTVTANYLQFWFRRFHSGIFDVKVAPRPGRPVIENVDKITEIIEVDQNVSSHSIAQELKIDQKTVLSHLSKVGFKKKLNVWMPHQLTPKNMMD
ncbi:histone-lysine N-methyltransferase SETMAR [Trichonephila clavipes]|nr:histone-lysine N-methyltransferase SETMAR [Trichonephila clavipes]